MEKSRLFLLNMKDAVRGLFVSVLTAAMTALYAIVNTGAMPDKGSIRTIGLSGLAAGLSYVIKNWLTNSKDQMFRPEAHPNP